MGLFDDLLPSEAPLKITVRPNSPESNAISSIESGGRYDLTGPLITSGSMAGQRANGKYQVMDSNVGPWTKQYFGEELTPQQFRANKDAQEAVFAGEFGRLSQRYGPEGAARAWFAGEGGMNNPNRKDQLGTTVEQYGRRFSAAMPGAAQEQPQERESALGFAQQQPPQPLQQPQAQQPLRSALGLFTDLVPDQSPVGQRFADIPAPANAAQLQPALAQRAANLTTGNPTSPAANMAIDQGNLLSAASQGTTPHIGAYNGKLISTQTFQDDAGNVLYRDPQTGQVKPTNNSTQIALRDPADNTIKVYQRSDATNESPVVGVSRVLAPGLMAGAPTARAALPATNKVQPLASDVFSTAKPYYREFTKEASKIEVPTDTASGVADRVKRSLDRVNLDPSMAGAPANAALKMLESGEPMTLDYLQRVKRMAARGFNSAEKDVRDGAAAVTKEIEKVISEVSPEAFSNLKTGDKIHQTAIAMRDLQQKGSVAGLRAGRAGYGGNAVNTMRQVLSPIVQRAIEGKSVPFKPNEIQAMREIVEGTGATNAARLVGQLSPTSGLGAIRAAGAGGTALAAGASGGAALAIPAIGAASNKLATILTGKQIERLQELVAKRSPEYAKAVSKAVARYEQSQMALVNDPSPNRFAAYVSASRALSAGLQKDGIEITSGALLKAIQSPVKSAAEGDQPAVDRRPGE